MSNTIKPTGKLIKTYMQGDSVITVYEDGDYEVAFKNGEWCDSHLTLEAQMRLEDETAQA